MPEHDLTELTETIREALPVELGGSGSTEPISVSIEPESAPEPFVPEVPSEIQANLDATGLPLTPESTEWLQGRMATADQADRATAERDREAQYQLLLQVAEQFDEVGVTWPDNTDPDQWDAEPMLNDKGFRTIMALRERGYSFEEIEELGVPQEYIHIAGQAFLQGQEHEQQVAAAQTMAGYQAVISTIREYLDGTPVDHDPDLFMVLQDSSLTDEALAGWTEEQGVELAHKLIALRDEVHKARVLDPQRREQAAMKAWGTDSVEEWRKHLEDMSFDNPKEYAKIVREVYEPRDVKEITARAILMPETVGLVEAQDSGDPELRRLAANNIGAEAARLAGVTFVPQQPKGDAISMGGVGFHASTPMSLDEEESLHSREQSKVSKGAALSVKRSKIRDALKAQGVPNADIERALKAIKA